MRRSWGIFAIVAFLLIAVFFLAGMSFYLMFSGSGNVASILGGNVGVVELMGPIMDSKDVVEDLDEMEKNDSISAIVLRIDSPGGAVAASQEIFEKVKLIKEKKPIVVSMGSLAASGGYYAACGASEIFASAGTATGSIGVKLEHVAVGDLMEWAKIKYETVKSGALKDLLPVDKPISPEGREILQSTLDDIHEQFRSDVAAARNLDRSVVDQYSDGRIFTGRVAKELGFIDSIGGFSVAVNRAAELGKIKGDPKLVYPSDRRPLLEKIFSSASKQIAKTSIALRSYSNVPVLMHAE